MELRINEGYCYQIIDRLLDVTTPSTARMLKKLASTRGAVEISKEDAIEKGFEELGNWAIPELAQLYVIDNYILVCIPKDGGPYA